MNSLPTDIDVLDYDNPEWSRQLLLYLRNNIPETAHDYMSKVSRTFVNERVKEPLPPCDGPATAALEALQADGFCALGNLLAPEQLAETLDELAPLQLVDPWNLRGPTFHREAAPRSVNVAEYAADAVLGARHLRDLSLGPAVYPVVANYLKVTPTLPYLMSWWSLHGRPEARDAQLFHVDFHDFKWLKLFVYLTDVDATTGPHIVVRGSHDKIKRYNMLRELGQRDATAATALRTAIRDRKRFEDAHVESLYGAENIVSIEGKAGDAFLVDTSAIHKGLPPQSADRLVFQALYTITPTIKNQVAPITQPGAYATHATLAGDAALSPRIWRYCNRLIMRDPEIESA